MTGEIFIVAYEGDDDSGAVLAYAMERALKAGASLLIMHVLEWSPYKFLTPTELEERHSRRKQEMARAQSAIIDPALEKARAAGVPAEGRMTYGNVVELLCKAARDKGAAQIFVGRSGGGFGNRVFGSVTIGLAETSPVPVVIVP